MQTKLPPTRMYSIPRLFNGLKSLLFGPGYLRRRTIHELARSSAKLLGGHYVGDDYKLWLQETLFINQFKTLSPHNYFSMERKFTLKEFARSVGGLPGAVAECGSYVGVSAFFIASELKQTAFYLFDSFEGLSCPTINDTSPDGMQQWAQGDLAATEEILKTNLQGFPNIHILKGWIPERFPEVNNLDFKLVHIDVDLYEPTRESLSFFYERMVQGGIIIMDDYGFQNCPGAYKAANEFMQNRLESIIHLTTGQGLIIKRF